jgi:hypothetical protein
MGNKTWMTIKRTIAILFLTCFIVLIGYTSFEIVFRKNHNLNSIEYLKQSFHYKPHDTDFINQLNIRKATKSDSTSNDNIISSLLNHSNNILDDTSNILTYLTILFTIFAIIGGIGIYKYVNEINKLKESVEAAERSTLDSSLVTLSAVPFIEATQITSSEYDGAIETITKTVRDKKVSIINEPKYAQLLIVEALEYWKMQLYKECIESLNVAEKLVMSVSNYKPINEISFYKSKAYKQLYFIEKSVEHKINAIKEAGKCSAPHKLVIELSISLIDCDFKKSEEIIIKCFKKENLTSLNEICEKYSNCTIALGNISRISAMATILTHTELQLGISSDILKICSKNILSLYDDFLCDYKGVNIKYSWYNTMNVIANHLTWNDPRRKKTAYMLNEHRFVMEESGIKTYFDYNCLTEVPFLP